ncbi:LAQU0S01e00738g1_1 [Lachancea quebecensis]|uniref:LAQU0S01e00738g1_1 n=1 Tax=Lachancea quebecensis TaxID=1654605 RepID=A0A0P1KNP2_9SACH|nr:LAQU0S01e00738g1_1 [Lachancea quebecensis]
MPSPPSGISSRSHGNDRSDFCSHDMNNLKQLAANWQNNGQHMKTIRAEMLKQDVLSRVDKITGLMNSDCKKANGTSEHEPVERLNWDEVYEVSANVMDLYTKDVDECLSELEKFYRKQYLWQEAAFTIDSHRGAARIGAAETWVIEKELHLESKRQELSSSAQIIKKTLEGLSRR